MASLDHRVLQLRATQDLPGAGKKLSIGTRDSTPRFYYSSKGFVYFQTIPLQKVGSNDMPEAGLKTMCLFRESWIGSSEKHLSQHQCLSCADCPHLILSEGTYPQGLLRLIQRSN